MYESRNQSPLQHRQFVRRLLQHLLAAIALILISLVLGMAGYMYYEQQGVLDAFLNASMLLGGMGPILTPVTNGGKLFAGCYALYAGLVFIATAALMSTPVIHRLLHRFHWNDKG